MKNDWEKRFDAFMCKLCKKGVTHEEIDCIANHYLWIKPFIRQELASQRREIVEEIRSGLLKEYESQPSQIQDAIDYIDSLTQKGERV